jgi:hypothetical protein
MDESKIKRLRDRYKWKVLAWSKYYKPKKKPGYDSKKNELWEKHFYQKESPEYENKADGLKPKRGYEIIAAELWLEAHDFGHRVPEKILKVFAEWVRKIHTPYIKKHPNSREGTPIAARATWLHCYDQKKDVPMNDQKLFVEWVRQYVNNQSDQHRSNDFLKQNYIYGCREKNHYTTFRDYRIVQFVDFMVKKRNISKEKAINSYVDFTERMHSKGTHDKPMTFDAVKNAYYKTKKEISKYGNAIKK